MPSHFEMFHKCDGPKWTDHCNHPEGTYLCSFQYTVLTGGSPDHEFVDMYVYPDTKWAGSTQSVCLRVGNEGDEYHSPGAIYNVIELAITEDVYGLALDALRYYGKLNWEKNGVTPEQAGTISSDANVCTEKSRENTGEIKENN